MLITPIMNDMLDNVGIASSRNGFEETSRLNLKPPATFRDALRRHAGNHLRQIIEDAGHVGIGFEYGGKQETMTAAHIRNAFNATEIIGIENGAGLEARVGGHCLVKILGLVRALGEQIEGMLAISLAHAVLARAKAMQEVFIRSCRPLIA